MSHAHAHSHHDHAHGGGCQHGHTSHIPKLLAVLGLTGLYMLVEALGSWFSGSLALLADAGHMLTDVGSIGLAVGAAWFSTRQPSSQQTFGLYRLEIFAAFLNGVALALLSIWILIEAIHRMSYPAEIQGPLMTWIAAGGLVVNLISAWILHGASQHNINVQGAFAHVVSDCLGSCAAIIAGVSVMWWNFPLADPILSILISILVLINGWKLISETLNILLEACPVHINVSAIRQTLLALPQVADVHDLHIWAITSGKEALSAHIMVKTAEDYRPELVSEIQHVLKHQFGLTHLTLQLEPPGFEEDALHF